MDTSFNLDSNYYDTPIVDKNRDLLNRQSIVKSISSLILRADLDYCVTVGLNGKWGCGKTSVMNLVEEDIKGIAQESHTIFLHFYPWYYSTQSNLVQSFFNSLITLFSTVDHKYQRKLRTKKLIRLTKIITKPLAKYSNLIELLNQYLEQISSTFDNISIEEMKSDISEELKKLETRVIVIIDDIDRLDGQELMQVFKLIRGVADFSNVMFILEYDELVVSSLIKNLSIEDPHLFLQKIINISISLPDVNSEVLHSYVYNKYHSIISSNNYDKEYEMHIMINCIYPYVTTLREANLIINHFKIIYKTITNPINPVNLLALSVIAIKKPEVYEWVKNNRYELTFNSKSKKVLDKIMDMKSANNWSPSEDYQKAEMDNDYYPLLDSLFPSFHPSGIAHHLPYDEHLICCKDDVDFYFIF